MRERKREKDNDRQMIICSSSWGGMEKTFLSLHWFVVVVVAEVAAAVVVDMLLFTFRGDGDTVVEGREAPARESSVWQHLFSPSNALLPVFEVNPWDVGFNGRPWSRTIGSSKSNLVENERRLSNGWDLTEIGMIHGFFGRQTLVVIVTEQFIEKVQRFLTNQMLIFRVHKSFPSFPRMSWKTQRNR